MLSAAPETLPAVRFPVVEQFYTVQGEGAWAGHAAYFIRLGGCDVGCPWCDTKVSWPADGHARFTPEELAARVAETQAPVVVVTGGEPTLHDLAPLTDALRATGRRIHLETSGAHPPSGRFDWITLSPKKYAPPVEDFYPIADELKIIVFNRSDFRWAEQHAARCPDRVRLLLQPEWERAHLLPEIVEYVKQHPRWRISLQTHKYLNVP